jgi:hypothetical protein
MELILLFVAVVVLVNAVASVKVLRVRVFSRSQHLLQLAIIWLVPIIGAVICIAFASSQALGPAAPSTHDPLYLPSDGVAPDGPGIGICACSGGGGIGDSGGGGD